MSGCARCGHGQKLRGNPFCHRCWMVLYAQDYFGPPPGSGLSDAKKTT